MSITFILFSAFIILAWAALLIKWVLNQPRGNDKMNEISAAISQGSNAFLIRQYKTIAVVAVPVTLILAVAFGIYVALGFVIGAVVSAIAGVVGMLISVRANVRVAKAAESGLAHAMRVAFRGGAVTGFFVVGLGLLAVSTFWLVIRIAEPNDIFPLVALGFGASLISVFARLGGGIYTKGADVGADLVGKIEAGIPEDDPRNPAVIADNVGDKVGDCAGMAADLFETYVVTIVATMLLGGLMITGSPEAVIYPLVLGGFSIIASILGTYFVKARDGGKIMNALYRGLAVSGVLAAIAFYPITTRMMRSGER